MESLGVSRRPQESLRVNRSIQYTLEVPRIGAGARSRIQARLSGMNIYYARTSKLVSDFMYLERFLVHNSAHAAHVPARLQASWARV